MNKQINEFVRICSETLPLKEPIYEFGAWQPPDQKDIAELRPLFGGKQYTGADIQNGPGVDIVLNLHKIDLPSAGVGTLLALETFEHVEYPRKAIDEIYRVLRPDGAFIMSAPMNINIHCTPDYWRYTPQGIKSLLQSFPTVFSGAIGDEDYPDTVLAVAFKQKVNLDDLPEFRDRFHNWQKRNSGTLRFGISSALKLFVPPVLIGFVRFLKYGRFWVRQV